METDRKTALAKGDRTFIGKVCTKDPEHGDERYASSGSCVACASERVYASRGKKRKTMGEMEVQALLLRGGPNSREMAEAAGLDWYKGDIGCPNGHYIVRLDGRTCAQSPCDWAKPDVDDNKLVVDLLS